MGSICLLIDFLAESTVRTTAIHASILPADLRTVSAPPLLLSLALLLRRSLSSSCTTMYKLAWAVSSPLPVFARWPLLHLDDYEGRYSSTAAKTTLLRSLSFMLFCLSSVPFLKAGLESWTTQLQLEMKMKIRRRSDETIKKDHLTKKIINDQF